VATSKSVVRPMMSVLYIDILESFLDFGPNVGWADDLHFDVDKEKAKRGGCLLSRVALPGYEFLPRSLRRGSSIRLAGAAMNTDRA
jgi:hypothetical protein